jgi:hypothetical protein
MKLEKIKKFLYPSSVIKSIKGNVKDIFNNKKYQSIITELDESGKLSKIGFKKEKSNLLFGVNLNPELLIYTEDSQESVELKFVSDASKKYTKFLENEGILDSITAEYERVKTEDFYGYIVKISYNSKFNKKDFIYGISYCTVLISTLTSLIWYIIS